MLQGPLPDSVITITEIANQPSSSLSTVVDISLYNNDGSEIQPEAPIEICFSVQSDKKNACLGFYDVKTNKWTCQDDCLKQKGKSMCGKTDHFTIFAILLGGSGDSGRHGGHHHQGDDNRHGLSREAHRKQRELPGPHVTDRRCRRL